MRAIAVALIAAALLTSCAHTQREPNPTPQAAPTPPGEGNRR